MRLRLLAAALLAFVDASLAWSQESCTCQSATFAWSGCAADGSCDPGAWQGCTPSPDDGYTIRNGCHVTLDASDVLLTQDSPQQVAIRAGGSLVARGPAELRLGPIGLVAEPGSRLELAGCFRRFRAHGDDCAPLLDTPALFPIGRVVPCRDGDCSDDAETVRLDWSEAAGSFATAVDELLDRIDVARDVLCFWQQTEAGALGADSGYCYKVSAVGRELGERHLDFDIRQVWSAASDQAGYPLARRLVHAATLAADAPAGTRTVSFLETTLVEGRAGPVGRFLRCEGDRHGYLIASATDAAGGDSVLLADAHGFEVDYAAGSTCHVDWGWAEWDLAFVMAPLHVTSHTPLPDRAQLLLEGETALRGVVVDGLGGQTNIYGAALEVRGGPVLAFEHVWVVDPLVTDNTAVLLDEVPCDTAVRHLVVSGGPADSAHDKNYGLGWYGGLACAYSLEHFYTRFLGDDAFVLESSGARPMGAIDVRYAQAGPSSLPGDSGQFLDFGAANPTSVTVRDALCTACTSDDGRGALVAPSGGPGQIGNLLWVGVRNGGLVTNSSESNNWSFAFDRFGVIGSGVDASNAMGAGPLAGLVADRFYVRDVHDPRISPNRLCAGALSGTQTRSLARGIFQDVSFGGLPCEASRAQLSDLYFIDVSRSGAAGALVLVPSAADDVALTRITTAFRRPSAGIAQGVLLGAAAAAPELAIDGLLLTGIDGAAAIRAMSLASASAASQVAWGAPSCFYGNRVDEAPAVLAGYGVAPVQGVEPGFVAPDASRFDLFSDGSLAGVGCGAGEAGYSEFDWAHRKTKLAPMYMAEWPPLRCGIGAELATVLAMLAWIARRSRS